MGGSRYKLAVVVASYVREREDILYGALHSTQSGAGLQHRVLSLFVQHLETRVSE